MAKDGSILCKTKFQPQFMLVPSLSCPASCSYCFGPNKGPAMDLEMIRQVTGFIESIIEETGQSRVRITLHGGEPLAAGYEVIESLITSLHERLRFLNLNIGIQSNLWLLDEKYCKLFSKYKVEVGTSLDGPGELNDRQRGSGYFEKTMNGIRLANSYGMKVSCIATLTSLNMPHWKEVFDFFLSENLHFSVHPSVPSITGDKDTGLTSDQYWSLFKDMFDYYVLHRKNIKISFFDHLCQGAASNDGRVCTFRDCFGMFLAIDPQGDIYSCQRFAGKQGYMLGNVSEKPTMDDLSSSPAAVSFLTREAAIREKCGSCEHYNYCKGGCAYNALAKNDKSDPTDLYCDAYKNTFTYIKQKIHEDMVSDENLNAIAQFGPSEKGNPLLRKGPVIELTKEHVHPYFTARTARRIVAAYELAKGLDIDEAAKRLAEAGICRTVKSAETSLESLLKNMKPHGQLNKLYIHVTWNCQLRCSHCYACAGSDAQKDEISAGNIEEITRNACNCGFKETVITGGEPLMHRDCKSLLVKLASLRQEIKPMKLVLRTNFAMPFSQEDHILLSKAFDNIIISVDGGKEEHDLRRGEGSYDKTVRNLELYSQYIGETALDGLYSVNPARLSITASMRADDVNKEPGIAVKDLAKRLRIQAKFRPLLPLGRALNYDEPVISEALRSYLTPLELMEEGFNPVNTCGIGQNLYLEPSGEAFPCYSYHKSHSYLGNVVKDGLAKVIQSDAFRELQCYSVDTNKGCRFCEYRYLCGGACRAWGKEDTQYDLDSAPIECSGLRKRAEELYRAALEYLAK